VRKLGPLSHLAQQAIHLRGSDTNAGGKRKKPVGLITIQRPGIEAVQAEAARSLVI